MVKNMIFKIAHSKVLNPMLKVFLCLLGDDVLEMLFGRSRMIGGHSPNHAVDELRQRICSALRMDKIFQKYPHLERHARRLRLVRARDVDHLSPRNWKGDLTAGSCNIHECYTAGVAHAKAVLAKYGCDIDFAARFSKEGFDLMRPNGGKYPGLSKEVDRSLGDALDSAGTEPLASADANVNDSLVPADILAYNAELALASEKAAHTESNGHSLWIDLTEDGRKKAHKKTILRTLMDPTFDINDNKSHDRLLRVRYYSIGGDSWDRTASTVYSKSTSEDHLLKIQGLFASLVCFNGSKTSLAILQCTGIKIVNTHPITYLEAAPSAEISLPDTRYEITGQILSLVPIDESNNFSGRISWAWIAQYVAFDSAKAKQASAAELPSRMRHLSVTVDGRLVLPLKSSDLKQSTLEEILNIPRPADKESEKTWVFFNEQLEVFGRILCERVTEDAVRMKIPVYGAVKDGRYLYEATIQDATTQTVEKVSHCFNFIVAPAPKDCHYQAEPRCFSL
ncbi:hypothetical protein R3P38DRAFT_2771988 [Favolaschia claudopus]|uniref:Uncharacterized protein n=1 Tax=Favolaschia claudopus TaxID=2862362 RepID=A0AAW0CAV0_9AGAR